MADNKLALTLGEFRKLTADLPDETLICPRFKPEDAPSDYEPGVEIVGIGIHQDEHDNPTIVAIWVKLFSLFDIEDPEEDEDDEE